METPNHLNYNYDPRPKNPAQNIQIVRGQMQIYDLIWLDLIVPASGYMATLHRTQLLSVKNQFAERGRYMTKSDFQLMTAIFRRYKEALQEKLGEQELKMLIVGNQEIQEHEEKIESLTAALRGHGDDSNFEVRSTRAD